jgi:hypothetical protein
MNPQTLFVAWQDQAASRRWFPIGRLDVRPPRPVYRFRYTKGAERAHQAAGFEPLPDFPSFTREYEASELFPLFQNRVMGSSRPDFGEYLKQLGLQPDQRDPIEILSVSGGRRMTDELEVFPKLERQPDGFFRCRFFLHGASHTSPDAQRRLESLAPGDKLNVALELTNPAGRLAVQIQSNDYYMLGWAPRYLVDDLAHAIEVSRGSGFAAEVVRRNPLPAPSRQRLLVEFRGRWPLDREPMSTEDFAPLIN